nr:hypothetical protein [uncultured Prevotella sp.]
MKQKKKFLYIILPIVLLCIVAFGYKFYCCDTVTDYLQVTYYPRMVKLYSVNWGYDREYDDPEVKVSIKKYENDSIAFSTEYGRATKYYESIKEFNEPDFLKFVNDDMNPNSKHYSEAMFYNKEIQKEIFLIKFEHTRMFDVKTLLADIKKIGIDSFKLEEYMKKNKIIYEFTPVWTPDLEDTPIALTFGGRRNRL